MNPIKLRQETHETLTEARKIYDAGTADGKSLSGEQANKINELIKKAEGLRAQADAIERLHTAENAERQAQATAEVQPSPATGYGTRPVRRTVEQRGRYFQQLARGETPERLVGEDWSGEYSDAAGAQMIPPDVRMDMQGIIFVPGSLAGSLNSATTNSNATEWPVDSDYDFQVSTGLAPNWSTECTTTAAGVVSIGNKTLTLRECDGLAKISLNQLEDGPYVGTMIPQKLARKIGFKLENALVNGAVDATTNPRGLLTAACAVTVAAESSQKAGTVVIDNILKMVAACTCGPGTFWLHNKRVMPACAKLTIGTQPVFIPGGSVINKVGNTLMGFPMVESLFCPTLGTIGDLMLIDPAGYIILQKGGLRIDVTKDRYFELKQVGFRAILRVDGQPILSSAITLPDSTTVSPIVKLATRS